MQKVNVDWTGVNGKLPASEKAKVNNYTGP